MSRTRLPQVFSAVLMCALAGRVFAGSPPVITLEEAYDRTLSSDQSVKRAYLGLHKADLEPLSALTRLGPSIYGNLNGATSHSTTRFDNEVFSDTTTNSRRDSGTLGLTYQQTIFDLTVIPAYRLGKLSAEAARLSYRETMRGVLFGVAAAYYEVLKQQQIVEVNQQTLELANQQLYVSESKAKAGEVTRSDELRARATVEADWRALIEAQNILESRRNSLANILNLAPAQASFSLVEPPNFPTTLMPFEALFATAQKEREDLRIQAIAIDQSVQRRGIVVGQYAPSVVARAGVDRSNISGTNDSRNHGWDASLGVSVPFFTGGQREIDLKTAGYGIQQSKLDYEIALKTVQQDVKDAWLTVRSLEGTLKALAVQVESARQAYTDIQSRYESGAATSVDVLTALNDLNVARRDLATQTYGYQVALRNLEQVSGVFQNRRLQRIKFQ